jgi:hypothetical protein
MHSKEIKQVCDRERKSRKLSYTEDRCVFIRKWEGVRENVEGWWRGSCHALKLNKTDIELWKNDKRTVMHIE